MDNQKHSSKLISIVKKFLSFNIIGLINTAITYGIYALAITVGINHFIALCIDYSCGITISFFMNKKFTFKIESKADIGMFLKMIIAYVPTFIVNAGLLWLFVNMWGMNKYLSQIIALGIVSLFSFFMQHKFVFKSHKKETIDGN
jgi:putative flippase GtrA